MWSIKWSTKVFTFTFSLTIIMFIIPDLIGLNAPTRVQTPGQAVRIAKQVWADPEREKGFGMECDAIEYYLSYNAEDNDNDSDDSESS